MLLYRLTLHLHTARRQCHRMQIRHNMHLAGVTTHLPQQALYVLSRKEWVAK